MAVELMDRLRYCVQSIALVDVSAKWCWNGLNRLYVCNPGATLDFWDIQFVMKLNES